MEMYSGISDTASLIGDPTRLSILISLADGRALTASELAKMAKVTPQTASAHLSKLVQGSLITVETQGRHRYYSLASQEVAHAIEAVAAISPPLQVRSLRESSRKKALSFARTCYGHLAGKLGVALTNALLKHGYFRDLGEVYEVTGEGKQWLRQFGIDPLPKNIDFNAVPHHIDWTVRKHHIAGPLALAITERLFELGWIKRGSIQRSVQITEIGHTKMLETFGIDTDALQQKNF
ncbi:DNA-binding transcriptional ArsR family regulator [Scopulibacillus daqui]|uniref:DNA-binding transcriptional ArsR family regulator n=1 Tax=Scopulibacillus daqui TaxID=1469162 RepID=A0ABS2Q317_9BACL|nr:winged helix-turn-helix domain-containing protein [Scopulibacillus daqui]MBM7646215.1 DNA-binding transcriptional ArsR family regulator [Scopulibacillus daqui]